MDLKDSQLQLITETVDDLFFRLKARLLGRFFTGPKIYFEVLKQSNPLDSLEGAFRYAITALYGPNAEIDEDQVKKLAGICGNYIEAERLRTLSRVLTGVESAKNAKDFEESLKENIDKANTYVALLSESETRISMAYAEREGISQLASSLGIEDPIVAKLGIIDAKTCKNCKKLWHLESNLMIPKVYKMSELAGGYMTDQKNPEPTLGATHPNCRHVMTFCPPNYGFDSGGNIEFKGFGWNEYDHQRSVEKSGEHAKDVDSLRKSSKNHSKCCKVA
jgi:hypothetical protein